MFNGAYKGRKVLVTGDTGFKGSWLAVWLQQMGAEVHGLALPPEGSQALYRQGAIGRVIHHTDCDIRDSAAVERVLQEVQPRIIFHLAAQALVRDSYLDPVGTMMTNVMGTAHLCDALRRYGGPCALVVITSDKCYENHEWVYGYRENDAMGGSDPYSASKGAAELITASWRRSFFRPAEMPSHGKSVASARAGNVIGPGDWAKDRIVPDTIRSLRENRPVLVRNPQAVRPWQHVLEPLSGYLWLGAGLLEGRAADWAEGWNFGPLPRNVRTVGELTEALIQAWGTGSWQSANIPGQPHEANLLRLSIDKAVSRLNWSPVWDFQATIRQTVHGYKKVAVAGDAVTVRQVIQDQIAQYVRDAKSLDLEWTQK